MNRTYKYRGFEVTVEAEPVWESSGNVTLLAPRGFAVVVSIGRAGATRPTVAPVRLMADDRKLFATEADALMTGYSAGQRVIDDILAA